MKTIQYLFLVILFTGICLGQSEQLPECFRKCNEYLDDILSDTSKAEFRSIKSDDVGMYHFGLGMHIRNIWLYGDRNPALLDWLFGKGYNNIDCMSHFILKVYWHHVNQKQFSLDSLLEDNLKEIEASEQKQLRFEAEANEAQRLVDSITKTIQIVDSNATIIHLPDNSNTRGVVQPTNYFKFKNAILIEESTVSYNRLVSYYYIFNINDSTVKKVECRALDTVYSIATINNSLYVAGSIAGKNRILRIDDGVSEMLSTTNLPAGSWIKLIAHDTSIYAQSPNGIFQFANGKWDMLFRQKIIDTSSHPVPMKAVIFNGTLQEIVKLSEELFNQYLWLEYTDILNDSIIHEQWDGFGASFYSSQMTSIFNDSDSAMYATYIHDDENNILRKTAREQHVLKSVGFGPSSIDRLGEHLYVFANQGIFVLKDTTAYQIVKFRGQNNPNGFEENTGEQFLSGKCFGRNKFIVAHPFSGAFLIDVQTGKASRIDAPPKKMQKMDFEEITK